MPLHKKSKRRGNASLKAWVAFVKKVQREEKLSYRDAMMRAKARKDKGEKWMKGGAFDDEEDVTDDSVNFEETMTQPDGDEEMMEGEMEEEQMGGRRYFLKGGKRRKTKKRRGSKKRRHTRRQRGGVCGDPLSCR
jgi:hypothetical protein